MLRSPRQAASWRGSDLSLPRQCLLLLGDVDGCPIIGRRGGRIRYARPDGIWYEATYEQILGHGELDLIC